MTKLDLVQLALKEDNTLDWMLLRLLHDFGARNYPVRIDVPRIYSYMDYNMFLIDIMYAEDLTEREFEEGVSRQGIEFTNLTGLPEDALHAPITDWSHL